MLMTQWLNLSSITSMVANTPWLMVSTEQLMSWSQERRSLSAVSETSEKDALKPWEEVELESMSLKLILSVLFKPACKAMKLLELRMFYLSLTSMSLPLETRTSSLWTICSRWRTTPLLETLDTSITKSRLNHWNHPPQSKESTSSLKSISSLLKMVTQSFFLLKVFLYSFRKTFESRMRYWSPLIRHECLIHQSNSCSTWTLEQQNY